MYASPRIAIAALGLTLVLAACSGSAPATTSSPQPTATPVTTPAAPSPFTPVASPIASPSAPSAPVSTPDATPAPPTAAPSADPEFTAEEQRILDSLRVNAQVHCVPRRSDLPAGARAGIECRIGTDVIDRIGAYQFEDDEAALAVYVDRLAENGVEPRSGDCNAGTPGDSAWTPGDGPGDQPGDPLVPYRSGCFHDVEDLANVRVLCGGGLYIGAVGATSDIVAVHDWVSMYDDNFPGDTPSPPGICYGPNTPS